MNAMLTAFLSTFKLFVIGKTERSLETKLVGVAIVAALLKIFLSLP